MRAIISVVFFTTSLLHKGWSAAAALNRRRRWQKVVCCFSDIIELQKLFSRWKSKRKANQCDLCGPMTPEIDNKKNKIKKEQCCAKLITVFFLVGCVCDLLPPISSIKQKKWVKIHLNFISDKCCCCCCWYRLLPRRRRKTRNLWVVVVGLCDNAENVSLPRFFSIHCQELLLYNSLPVFETIVLDWTHFLFLSVVVVILLKR